MGPEMYGILIEAVRVLFISVVPVVLAVTLAGLIVGTLQAATTIYDVALGYAARVAAVILVVYVFFASVSQSMIALAQLAFQ